MQRTLTAELLDEDLGTRAEIAQSFDDLWRINRWLGGVHSNLFLLERVFERAGVDHLRVLDVGAGDARLAKSLARVLGQRKLKAEFVALDRRHGHLRNGHPCGRGLPAVAADVFDLPFRENSFDVVMCNLFFHHFSGERAQELLQRLAAMASHAVIVNDLERNLLPYLFIRIAYPFARSRITRHDGPASVRQAYTRAELQTLAARAGFRNFTVERLGAFRLGLTLWKSPAAVTG
jgi:2-polyprenyl-3-methyl-5-hydroxy-6-metoxy-1,4-benzoquinol methylase